jgi:hypothetical protein
MLRKLVTCTLATTVMATGLALSGCGTDVSEGTLPEQKPFDAAAQKAKQKELMDGMKGGKGMAPPGAPTPKAYKS